MLTRNHGAYLAEAIASVQAQTLQAWELLIGEDDSSDDTAQIATQAAQQDGRIRVFSSPGGALGFHANFARLLEASQAPYVAFLEGDDWWSEPCKLQLQVHLLKQNPGFAFCGGRTRVLDQRPSPQGGSPGEIGPVAGSDRLGFEQLIDGYNFHFSTILMRREVVQLPPWVFHQYCLDRPLYLLAACHGDAAVLDRYLSVYRLHQSGVWAPLTPLQRACRSRQLFTTFCRMFPRRHGRRFRVALSNILWSYLAEAIRQRRRFQTFAILVMGVQAAPGLRLWRQPRTTLGALRRAFFPLPIPSP